MKRVITLDTNTPLCTTKKECGKYVLVTIDSRESTASRKNVAVDLITLWSDLLAREEVNYEIAVYPLPVGDFWISVASEPIIIPDRWNFTKTKCEKRKEVPSLDDYFKLPDTNDMAGKNIIFTLFLKTKKKRYCRRILSSK